MSDELPAAEESVPAPVPAAGADVPEPGNPVTARLAALAVLLLIIVVAALQQVSGSAAEQAAQTATAQAGAVPPPAPDFELTAKVFTKIVFAVDRNELYGRQTIQQLNGMARGPADQLRVAIIEAELAGPEVAAARLDTIASEAPPDSLLARDTGTVRAIYVEQVHPDPEVVAGLSDRHVWFGRLAAAYAKGPDDAEHARLVGGGGWLIGVMAVVFLAGGAALLAGFVLLTLAVVAWATGRRFTKFAPRRSQGSVLIETVAVFVGGFLLLKLSTGVVGAYGGADAALWFALICQWLLLLTLLWPWVRGQSLDRSMRDLGLHRGRGVLVEIGAGLVGYVACLPILATGVVISMLLLFLYTFARAAAGLPEPPPPSNEVIEMVAETRGTFAIVLLFLLASMWAPLAEESIFRGALYGHLRRRWMIVPAAIVTALGFGLMHGYMVLLLGPVIALGVGFSLMREWRDSLIAPITAHCLHNAMVLSLLLVVFRIVEG